MPSNQPSVTAVIVSFNPGPGLRRCIASILDYDGPLEVVIVDNGSTDGSLGEVPEDDRISIELCPDNPGFGAAVNYARHRTQGQVMLILNPDVILSAGAVAGLAHEALSYGAIVGPELFVAKTGRMELGATMNHLGMPSALTCRRPPLYVPGCAMAIPLDIFDRLGGFDARYFLFVEDAELCWRALLSGVDVRVSNRAYGVHEGGSSLTGGYPCAGKSYETSEIRVALRERNTVALMLTCAPILWLPFVIPAITARTIALAIWTAISGQRHLGWTLLGGLVWNIRQLRSTITRRRTIRRSPTPGYRRRLTHAPLMLKTVAHHGIPVIR